MPTEPYAEDLNYWRTGNSAPDSWIDRARREIVSVGGKVVQEAYGSESGRAAFLLAFQIAGESYRVVWPVLRSRAGNDRAAKIQAATFLYHEIKARCMTAKVLGARASFFNYLVFPDGRTAVQLSAPELADRYPRLLAAPPD